MTTMETVRHNFFTSLDDQDLLQVSGEDSEKFLQGQLTCDLASLADGQYIPGALCNNKGRVYASFRVLKLDKSFYLAMRQGLLENTQRILQKYIPFYKATLADAGARFHRIGLAGPEAASYLEKHFPTLPATHHSTRSGSHLLANPGGSGCRYEIWSPADTPWPDTDFGNLEQADTANWKAMDMVDGMFFTGPDDVEQYTPEETNLDLAGFVSFDKGCYTGQEIVARMHYRGKAGKRLFRVTVTTDQPISGGLLKDPSGKSLGNVTSLVKNKQNYMGYVVMKTATDLSQALLLETPAGDIPVTVTALTYSGSTSA